MTTSPLRSAVAATLFATMLLGQIAFPFAALADGDAPAAADTSSSEHSSSTGDASAPAQSSASDGSSDDGSSGASANDSSDSSEAASDQSSSAESSAQDSAASGTEDSSASEQSSGSADAASSGSATETTTNDVNNDTTDSTSASTSEETDTSIHATGSGASEEGAETGAADAPALPDGLTDDAGTAADSAAASAPEVSDTPETPAADGASSGSAPSVTATAPSTPSTQVISQITGGDSTTTATAPADASTTSITTGNAFAIANILNLLNTNFVNSLGVINFSNFLDTAGTIDTRGNSLFSGNCSLFLPCTGDSDVSLNFVNTASIDNQVTVQAASGGNAIQDADTGAILTGTAFAGLNLINLANANFTDSNYFILALNAFKSVNGDIVLPSLANFFSGGSNTPSSVSIVNDGTADNDVTASSDSGNNASTATSSTITTGASLSFTNIMNTLNTDILNNSLSVLFRIGGAWNGEVFDAPEGLSWTRTGDGILFSSSNAPSLSLGGFGSLTENATNTAAIHNQVAVTSASGQNTVQNVDTAAITTGDALAAANVVNIANTNIIGKNWMLAIINIFGDFNGNIAFGRPDLWVGSQIVSAPAYIQNGDQLSYTITVRNNGDATASDAHLTTNLEDEHLALVDATAPYAAQDDGSITWDLGSMAPGASKEFTFHAAVHDAPIGTRVTTVSTAAEHETDNAADDNTDSVSFSTSAPGRDASPRLEAGTEDSLLTTPAGGPTLKIVRTPLEAHPTGTGRTVHESLSVENMSSMAATNVVLHDIIRAPDGTVIDDEPWDIGTIHAKELIEVGYDAAFADTAPAGTYELTTTIEGANVPAQDFENGTVVLSADEVALGEVLGISTTTTPVAVTHKKQAAHSFLGTVFGSFGTKEAHAADGEPSAPTSGTGLDWVVAAILSAALIGAAALAGKRFGRYSSRA